MSQAAMIEAICLHRDVWNDETKLILRLMQQGFLASEITANFDAARFQAMNENAENVKKKPVGLVVNVRTFDVKSEEETSNQTMNFNDPGKQDWLRRHIIYAVNNHQSVEISHLDD